MAAGAWCIANRIRATHSRLAHMTTRFQSLRERLQFLKAPAIVVLILAGFVLEFIVELPFRIMAAAAGKRF